MYRYFTKQYKFEFSLGLGGKFSFHALSIEGVDLYIKLKLHTQVFYPKLGWSADF